MGLSAFSRSRVSLRAELEIEAERFDEWNKMHQKSFRDIDDFREKAEEKIVEIREAMIAGVQAIGEKVVEGLAENTEEGDPIDLPLRLDHVRDMVGRRHVEDPQGEPKSTLERLRERIPESAPASEAIVHKTDVDSEGPTREDMIAAEEEQVAWQPGLDDVDPDTGQTLRERLAEERLGVGETLPEPGEGAGVKGETVAAPAKAAVPKAKVPRTAAANVKDASKEADEEFKK